MDLKVDNANKQTLSLKNNRTFVNFRIDQVKKDHIPSSIDPHRK
jgi:hypothetical protein